ncbi:MAG: TonB-dependent receptor [Bacteroidales bacterium]|jgi:iron complex outermembrane receptor protein|nr:TonB-dependent receptor [Bacteroidales bacterium]
MKTISNKLFILFIIALGWSMDALAQEPDTLSASRLFELSLEDLMNVEIVSAVRQNQNIIDAPSIVSVITSNQIKERGYSSLEEAINNIAGLDIITDHFQPNLGIRGINGGVRSYSRLIKVMIDGQNISFRSNADNYLGLSLIPIEAIEKIEIIRGPNSAIYGKNAFLGVINIITRKGKDIRTNRVSHFLGTTNNNSSFGLSTLIGGAKNNFDFLFASTYAQLDYAGLKPHAIPEQNTYITNDVSQRNESVPMGVYVKMNYETENWGKFTFDMVNQKIDSDAEFADWGAINQNNRISLFNSFERLQYSKELWEKLSADFSFTHSVGKPISNETFDDDTDPTDWIERELKYNSYDVSGNFTYFFDDINLVSLGIDFTSDIHDHQKFYTRNTSGLKSLNPGGTEGEKIFTNLGIFIQMIVNPAKFFNLSFLEELTFTGGYRYDMHNIYGNVLTYRFAAVYHLNKDLSTKLMYGTSFNAPSSTQLYTNYISPGGFVGNPELKPERARTLDWALMGKITENINFSTNLFYTEIEDKIEYLLPYGQISNITAGNISNIYSGGFEAEVNVNHKNNKSYLNYSYQKSILEKSDPIRSTIKVNTALYPSHMIKLGNTLQIPDYYLNINLEARFISSRIASDQNNFIYDPIDYTTNRYTLDPYYIVDLSISSTDLEIIKNSKSRFILKFENLLDYKYYFPGFNHYDIPALGRSVCFRFTHYI